MATLPHKTSLAHATVHVRGQVQGVGFRPTVWRLARECGLTGEVGNDGDGVWIEAHGTSAAIDELIARLGREQPPLARIDTVERAPLTGGPTPADFRIASSRGGDVRTGVAPDAATCPECLAEIRDPQDRRHGYPFANCTHCGPRLSIVNAIPYDRANTSMAAFPMCPRCRAEYEDPADRRFHAQPNACPDCGPTLCLETVRDVPEDTGGDPIAATRRLLQSGHIVAIKGLGGIHLACDATDAVAVHELRRRKRRQAKPFALMARDTATIRRFGTLDANEEALLREPAAPIVLLAAGGAERLAAGVAPGQTRYGFMLPYSPLHHLLMAGLDAPIVLTSGNRSDEPQCTGNDEARERLACIADAFLLHDRAIVNRVDDSVVRRIAGTNTPIRRARGYAPAPLALHDGFRDAPDLLALGGELKNTFCLLRSGQATLSQHLGDLENAAANAAYRETLALYQRLYRHRPGILTVDAHPDYLPSKLGRERAGREGLPLEVVQHHHAHIAACLADNGAGPDIEPVLGVALDGTGYGDDGSVWGGEFLLADYRGYRRLAALAPVAMPGAAQAVRQPWRMGYSHLRRVFDWSRLEAKYAGQPFFRFLADKPLRTLAGMIDSGFNSPATTSCGRLFDAVAAVLGIRHTADYEGQAAIELEAAVDAAALDDRDAYPFTLVDGEPAWLDPAPMWRALLRDLRDGLSTGVVAARFHTGLAGAAADMIRHLAHRHGDLWHGRIALSGGVFQNAMFSEALVARLESSGLQVLRHSRVPANDGGLSLGQAAVAAARALSKDKPPCA